MTWPLVRSDLAYSLKKAIESIVVHAAARPWVRYDDDDGALLVTAHHPLLGSKYFEWPYDDWTSDSERVIRSVNDWLAIAEVKSAFVGRNVVQGIAGKVNLWRAS